MKEFVYLSHPSQIPEARKEKGDVREKARRYLVERFGFDYDDFALNIEGVGMWRQFFGIHIENAVAEVLCRIHGFERFDLTYLMDGFSTRNPFKMSLVRMRILRNFNGKFELLTYRLADEYIENQVIEDIWALSGLEKAYTFHRRLMRRMGYTSRSIDTSELLMEFTKHGLSSMKRDEAVKVFNRLFVLEKAGSSRVRRRYDYREKSGAYVSKDGRDEIQFSDMVEIAEKNLVLPSSETYYSHFFFFIPGILEPEFIQIEAEFEIADAEILEPAINGFWRVKETTGCFPSLIPIKDLNAWSEMALTKNPGCLCICMDVDEMADLTKTAENDKFTFMELSVQIARKIFPKNAF